jgi:hypothetical protein
MSGTLETTNTLLTWLVIATALTPLFLVAAGVAAMLAWKRMRAQLERELGPVLLETRATLQEVQHIAASIRRRVDEVDRGVSSLQHKTSRLTDSIRGAVGGTLGRVLSIMAPGPARRAS